MKTQHTHPRSFIALALFALFCLHAPLAHAQEVVKIRGLVQSVDVAAKTIQLLQRRQGELTLKWTDDTRVRSEVLKNAADLKPGMFILCFMEEDRITIRTIRHMPGQDQIKE
jgi:hypothetical protein